MRKFLAWLLAFLLTGSLVLFGVSFIGRRLIVPALGDQGAKVSARVAEAEKELIKEKVNELSQVYGFTPEPVIAAIGEETLSDLNAQAALWWSSVLADGTIGEPLKMDTKPLRTVLAEDPLVQQNEDPEAQAETIADAVAAAVARVVLPLRQETVNIGLREAGKRVDLVNLVNFFIRVPWAALALSALLAGLIALLESSRLIGCLKYIGSAMGAAAIVLLACAAAATLAGVRPMIREASRSLAAQYDSVLSGAWILVAVLAAVLLAGYVLCMVFCTRRKDKA